MGEAPAAAELQIGKPFSGGAGVMLQHMMSRAGISMSQCFLTNVVHVPAPRVKGKALFDQFYKPGPLQVDYLRGVLQLKKDIEEIKPNLIIGLGNGALFTLTGKKGIDKWRGSILESKLRAGQKVICTYSHGFPLQVYEAKAVVEIDLARCAEDAKFPELNLPQREYFLNPEPSVRQGIVDEMLAAEWLAIDIECLYDEETGKWKLTCVGFSDHAGRALVIPWGDALQQHHIRILCESPVKKVYQNGMFDVSVLRSNGVFPQNFAWDTMSGHHSLMAECASGEDEMSNLSGKKRTVVLKKGLAFQTSIYTREPYYKDDGKVSADGVRDWQQFWLYNGRDAAVTREILDIQLRELEAWGGMESARRKVRLAEPLMAATARGIRIDTALRKAVHEDFDLKIENLQNFLDGGAGRHINVKATKDVQWLLYDKLNLPIKTNRKSGNVTADKNAINELAGEYSNPLLQTVLRIREYRDFIERYLNAPLSADGRMRCSFDPTGTKSNRLASRASLDGSGTNLQNIPVRKKEGALIRQMFLADEGKVLVVRDYKQAETWVVAYLARCIRLIELLNDPTKDIHYENASMIYGVPISEISKYPQRYLAKRTGHGSNYGLFGDRLRQMIDEDAETTGVRVTTQEAQMLIDKYFMLYPELRTIFWREVENEIRRTRTLETPMGAKRAFYGDMRDAKAQERLLREAYSYIPQSTVGELCNEAVIRCYENIQLARPDLGAEFLLAVHDSIMMQCNDGCEEEVAALMEENMRMPLTIHDRTFIIPSDCQVGYNWNTHSEKNPNGLREWDEWLEFKHAGIQP